MRYVILSFGIATMFLGGIIFLLRAEPVPATVAQGQNVSIVDGKQIITIDAKGGYQPRSTTAKANIPTVIRLNTKATFDCSSAVVIPSLRYRSNLPPSGETSIDVPPQKVGSTLQGLCAMGMYNFAIHFN